MKGINLYRLFGALIGAAGGAVAALFGGWDTGIATLLIFMCVDFFLGLLSAAVFKVSSKTESGALESRACWKGLCRKFGTLAVVLIACRLDLLLATDYIRDAVVICYLFNEAISITENLALIGVPIPSPVKDALDLLSHQQK